MAIPPPASVNLLPAAQSGRKITPTEVNTQVNAALADREPAADAEALGSTVASFATRISSTEQAASTLQATSAAAQQQLTTQATTLAGHTIAIDARVAADGVLGNRTTTLETKATTTDAALVAAQQQGTTANVAITALQASVAAMNTSVGALTSRVIALEGATPPAVPNPPTSPTSTAVTSTSVSVSAIAPASGPAPTSYKWEYKRTIDTLFTTSALTTLTGTIGSLAALTSYGFRASAVNAVGPSVPSALYTVSTAAGTVVESAHDATVTTTSGSIVDQALNIYQLVVATPPATGLQITINGVLNTVTNQVIMLKYYNPPGTAAPGVPKHTCVQQNAQGGWYMPTSIVANIATWVQIAGDPDTLPVTVPNPPTSPTSTAVTSTSVSLSATAPATGPTPTSYKWEYKRDIDPIYLVSSVTTLTGTQPGLTPITLYDWRVSAVNSLGPSAPSVVYKVSTAAGTPTESPDGATVTTTTGSILDAAGHRWALASSGGIAPAPAAAAGFFNRTFGPAVVPGTNWFTGPNGGAVTVNGDGSVTFLGSNGYSADLQTVALGGGTYTGSVFGGGGYFEMVMKYTGPGPSGVPVPAFWANDIENQLQAAFGTGQSQWPGQAAGYVDSNEWDIVEVNAGLGSWGFVVHNWYGFQASIVKQSSVSDGSPATGLGDQTQYHRYGGLWVPATATAQGYIQHYFDGVPKGNRIVWNQYNPSLGPPPVEGSNAFSRLDVSHIYLILGTGPNNPMTVQSVEVWQAGPPTNNNLKITIDGVIDPVTNEVILLKYYNPVGATNYGVPKHTTVQENAQGGWYYPTGFIPGGATYQQIPGDPSATQAPGTFSVSNGKVLAPDGTVFQAKGINIADQSMGFATKARLLAMFPGINIVRLAIGAGANGFANAQPTQTIIDYVTALTAAPNPIVVVLDNHLQTGGTNASTTAHPLYTTFGNAFKTNSWVWIESENEVVGEVSKGHLAAYNAVRATGNNNIFVCCTRGGNPANQGGLPFGATGSSADYAGMTSAIWDMHWYNWVTNGDANQTNVNNLLTTDITAWASVATSVNGVMPVWLGEGGFLNYTGDPDVEADGDAGTNQIVTSMLTVGKTVGVGGCIWLWNGGPFNWPTATDLVDRNTNTLTAHGIFTAALIAA